MTAETMIRKGEAEVVGVIPVAGSGKRLGTLGTQVPKCLLPLGGVTLLDHAITQLAKAGIEKFVFIVGDSKKQILAHLETYHQSINYEIVEQTNPTGLVDAIFCAENVLKGKNFCISCPDNYFLDSYDIYAVLRNGAGVFSSVVITKQIDLSRLLYQACFTGEFSKETPGFVEITDISSGAKTRKESGWVSTGFSLETPLFFQAARKVKPIDGERRLFDVWKELLNQGNQICAHRLLGAHLDITTQEDYQAAVSYLEKLGHPKGVAAILKDRDGRYLLMERDNKPGIRYPGYWALFGGTVDQEETPLQAIHRELYEELGLKVSESSLVEFCQLQINLKEEHYYVLNSPIDPNALDLKEGKRMGVHTLPELCALQVRYDDLEILQKLERSENK